MERGCANQSLTDRTAPATNSVFETVDICVNHSTLSYAALEAPVLEQFDHSFSHGKVHAVIGPSGSGKSTPISALLGLHKPEQGAIEVQLNDQETITLGEDLDLHNWILNVGYLSQQPFLFQGTVRDNLDAACSRCHTERRAGKFIDPKAQVGRLPRHTTSRIWTSRRWEQLLERWPTTTACPVAGASNQEACLHLDEATSALDNELRDVVDLLQERAAAGCNVILVTHDNELAQRCDDVLNLGKS